jgi:muconate cycloisomerase
MSPLEAAREAALVVEAGVRTLKLKIGVEPKRDVETVKEVRQAVGDGVLIRVDANRGYPTAHDAIKAIRQMEKYDLLLVEQPVEGLTAMAQIAKIIEVPLMADEGVWTAYDALRIHEKQAAQYLNVYITKAGGLIGAKKLINMASVLGQICGVGGMVELGVGTAANLHFVASTPEINLACGLPVPYPGDRARKEHIACSYYKDHLEKNPPLFENGYLHVPKGPGLGIELDEKKVEKYRL